MSWWGRAARWGRTYRLDLIWVAFVGINLAAMRLLPSSSSCRSARPWPRSPNRS
jgi:hypothetical protein